jgi:hypothetical protein
MSFACQDQRWCLSVLLVWLIYDLAVGQSVEGMNG